MFGILHTAELTTALLAASSSISASVDANIFTGIDSEDLEAPAVICNAETCEEVFPESRVYKVTMNVISKEIAADTSLTASLGLNRCLEETFADTNIVTALNNLTGSNLYVYGLTPFGFNNSQTGDAWSQTIQLNLVCGLKQ